MIKAYLYRLYPNEDQKELFEKHFGCARWVYNYGLQRKIEEYQKDESKLSCFDINKEITQLKKKEEYSWLSDVNSQSLQCATRNLDNAFTSFFNKNNSFPKFKSKYSRKSFQLPQGVFVEDGYIKLPKIKSVKAKISRTFNGKIKTTTISKTPTGKYYASMLVEDGKYIPEKKEIKKAVGIDLGIKTFATLSNGEKIDNPKFLNNSLKRLVVLQRRLSKKKKGSKNREKAKHKVALLHERMGNQRQDFLHKLSKRLIDENQAIALEDLNVAGMVKNRSLSRHISDSSWSEFVRMLEYKSEWYGSTVAKIGRFQPSSKICSCGHIKDDLTLADRVWTCGSCGLTHDRDILASQNILKFSGLGESVEPVEMLSVDGSMKQEAISTPSKIYPSWIGWHKEKDWDNDWRNIIYIKIPIHSFNYIQQFEIPRNEQLSWHIHKDDLIYFQHLKPGLEEWDGHTTDEKYERLFSLRVDKSEPKKWYQFWK